MHKERAYFLWGVFITLLVAGAVLGFQVHESNKIRSDLVTINENLITVNEQTNMRIDLLSDMFDTLSIDLEQTEDELAIAIDALRQESESRTATLESSLQSVKEESENLQKELNIVKSTKSDDFTGIIEDAVKAVVAVGTDIGSGSGFFYSTDGYIVTNHHVIDDARQVAIKLFDGRLLPVQLIGYNVDMDVAVLKANGDFERLRFADSDDVSVGQKAIAIGNPRGLEFSVTEGIISALNRASPTGAPLFQTDVSINPGNSGGPLLDNQGRVVGVNTLKFETGEGLGFALKANDVEETIKDIITQYEAQLSE